MKKPKKIPKFKSEKEAAEFWSKHSPLDYPDEFKEIKKPFQFDVDFLKKMAKETEGYTGADIEAICREAGMNALREDIKSSKVYKKHFDESLKKLTPSLTPSVVNFYENMDKQLKAVPIKKGEEDDKLRYVG